MVSGADPIWEHYARDGGVFQSHDEPNYITQQYIKHLEGEVQKWRKIAERLAGWGSFTGEAEVALYEYREAARGE